MTEIFEKLDLQTPDFVDENIAKLAELFPNCVTEKLGDKGELEHAIDFDALRQEFSSSIVEGPAERYSLNWPGKRKALVAANTPINKTLRPCRKESVEFDSTKNIFIEGDNRDALKLLQETYLGKIKMIYIDPPYNTGNDFIYNDNFTADKQEYDEASEQKDEEGGRLVANPDSNGRFHSDWLSMIYPRLKRAQSLLDEDGIIFISIADHEIHNLRKMCDEIFGENNFIACFLWKKKGTTSNVKDAQVSSQTDYQLCYGRSKNAKIKQRFRASSDRNYPHVDEDGSYRTTVIEKKDSGAYKRDTMKFEIIGHKPRLGKRWQIGIETAKELENKNRFIWDGEKILQKIYNFEDNDTYSAQPNILDNCGTSASGSELVNDTLFAIPELFDNPKPVELLSHLSNITLENDGTILDFFCGSGTTAHAVMQLNAEDGGNRKCISVQLPEITDEKSEAFKAGYKNIAEIAKERIRRAGKKIKEDNAGKEGIENLDIGFRVFKIDSSNMEDVHLTPDDTKLELFDALEGNIKQDRSSEDLLFQVLLDWGVDLSLSIEHTEIDGKQVFFVDNNALAACFDKDINEEFVTKLAERQPLRVVFRDDGFANDAVKINIEQIFKLKSPATDIKVI